MKFNIGIVNNWLTFGMGQMVFLNIFIGFRNPNVFAIGLTIFGYGLELWLIIK